MQLIILLIGTYFLYFFLNVKGNLFYNNPPPNEKKTLNVQEGDVFLIKKNVNHIFETIEYSKWINVLSKKLNKDKPDIHRIINS